MIHLRAAAVLLLVAACGGGSGTTTGSSPSASFNGTFIGDVSFGFTCTNTSLGYTHLFTLTATETGNTVALSGDEGTGCSMLTATISGGSSDSATGDANAVATIQAQPACQPVTEGGGGGATITYTGGYALVSVVDNGAGTLSLDFTATAVPGADPSETCTGLVTGTLTRM